MTVDLAWDDPAGGCAIGTEHRPRPLHLVTHHVLPKCCGGKSTPDNEIKICDNHHRNTHVLLRMMRDGAEIDVSKFGALELALAHRGYALAVEAGTVDKIPNEGAID